MKHLHKESCMKCGWLKLVGVSRTNFELQQTPDVENPQFSLNRQEKYSHQNPAIAVVSIRIQHKIFWNVFFYKGIEC